jgi:hypothetical protein
MPPRVNPVDALSARRSHRNVSAQNYAQMDNPWRRRSRSASPSPAIRPHRERSPLPSSSQETVTRWRFHSVLYVFNLSRYLVHDLIKVHCFTPNLVVISSTR